MEAYAEKAGIRTRLDVDGVRTAAGNFDLSEASTPSLAWSGIAKNRKFYLPYLLTCIGMPTMYYIIAFLTANEIPPLSLIHL